MPLPLFLRRIAHVFCLLPLPAFACGGALHIELEHSGVYALSYAEIVAKQPGLVDCAVEDLAMNNRGQPVPLRMVDNGNGRFDDGDRIEWIGQQLHGPMSWFNAFSINNVYLLSAEAGGHARMTEQSASGSGSAALQRTLHFEQENLMIRLDQAQQKPGEESDVWQWAKLTHADAQPFTTEFDLPDLAPNGESVPLRLSFRGISSIIAPANLANDRLVDHVVEVRINGQLQKRLGWNGRDQIEEQISVPSGLLKPSGNILTLTIPKRELPWIKDQTAIDLVMFNWAEIRYPMGGDLESSALPLQAIKSSARPLELEWNGADTPALYGDDGVLRPGQALGNGRFRFAAADEGVTLYPLVESRFASPLAMRRLNPTDWHAPASGYDYLIVSHASLIDAIRPLAAFHEKRGLKVAVIDIEDVYDSFNFGITHPQAVRNLIDHSYHNWPQPRPRFLLLVGDASFDIRHETYNDLAYAKFANSPAEMLMPGHFSGIPATAYAEVGEHTGSRNLIPTWQFPSSEGQSASDNWFAAVDGDDFHPVIAVGRFPVVEPAEVTAIVDKTIDYMSRPQPGVWRRDVMFITDESEYFKKSSDEIASSIGKNGFLADKVYASSDEADNLAHQSAIKDGINGGQVLVHFIGHGGRFIWRTGPPDLRKNHDLFTLDDVSALHNSGRLPMILSMTCYSAPFDNPTEDSIGERFLREADKGAIAVFAASWRNSPSTAFSKSLVTELLAPGATIGEGIVRAKKENPDRTMVEMYNLLGDPAVVLERPRAEAQLMLDANAWNPAVLVSLPGARFSGAVAVDWLDASSQRLSTSNYQVDETVFRVAIPKFADGKIAHFVRVYATDIISGQDAAAGLNLNPAAQAKVRGFRLPEWARFWQEPEAADTLLRDGYDEQEALEAANSD